LPDWSLWASLSSANASASCADVGETTKPSRIYQALLRRLSSAGLPRRPCETPHEYLARIRDSPVEGVPAFARLTDTYTSVRYGAVAVGPDLVAELRREANQIRAAS
jgi:hypothetical protein